MNQPLALPKNQTSTLLPNYPKFAWLWLINLAFFFIQPIAEPASLQGWTLNLVALSIFLALFIFNGRSQSLAFKRTAAFLMLGLAILTSKHNAGANVFFIFAAANFGHLWKPKPAVFLVCLTVVAAFVCQIVYNLPIGYFFIPAAVVSLMVGLQAVWLQREDEIERARLLSQQELQQLAAYAERERIGRDLHDLLGHSLSVIQMRSQLAKTYLDDPEANRQKLQDELETLIKVSKEALRDVRESVVGMRSQTIDNELTHLKIELSNTNVLPKINKLIEIELTPIIEMQISLILRELITNILRHSKASSCSIDISNHDQTVVIIVADNGIGCKNPTGNGTQGVQARVQALQGHVKWENEAGCKCTVTIPVLIK